VNVAISNIAWDRHEDEPVRGVLESHGVKGVEVAPTKVWDRPLEATDDDLLAYSRWWAGRGMAVVAAQSLLFGRPDLVLFREPEARARMLAYLSEVVRVCATLGARALVFGSPGNRIVGGMPRREAMEIAVRFFSDLGDVASEHGTCLCIEANPAEYGADFVQTTAEATDLVRRVANPGFRLHADVSTMIINGEECEAAIEDGFDLLRHVHVSEPHLGIVGAWPAYHARVANRLRTLGYDRWVSIEMRAGQAESNPEAVRRAVEFAMGCYG
jgi:sugar phosphate isomerase/epimerase